MTKVLDVFKSIISFLEGKKAYIVGTAMVAVGLYVGDNNLALEGMAVITIRAGIKKAE